LFVLVLHGSNVLRFLSLAVIFSSRFGGSRLIDWAGFYVCTNTI